MMNEQVRMPSGLLIDLRYFPSSDDTDSKNLAVLLHPWSWLGGNMDDPVLQYLTEVFTRNRYNVLRYNSRGVGQSSGWRSFSGQQEVQDLQEIVRWGLDRIGGVQRLIIAGYSYGSIISACHPVLPQIKTAHLILSYPLDKRGLLTLFQSSSYASALSALVKEPSSFVLVLHGDRDAFTSSQSYSRWTEQLRREAGNDERLRVVAVSGASHFWAENREKVKEMCGVVEDWIQGWA